MSRIPPSRPASHILDDRFLLKKLSPRCTKMSDRRTPERPPQRSMRHSTPSSYQQSLFMPNALGIYSPPTGAQPPYTSPQYSIQQSSPSPATYRSGSGVSGGASYRTSRTPTTITSPDSDDDEQSQLSSLCIPSVRALSHAGSVVGGAQQPTSQSAWGSSPYIRASSVTRQLDHAHDYLEHDMPNYANTQMSIGGVGNWAPGQAVYDPNGLLVYKAGDYVYVRRRKNHVRPTEPVEWSNWVCGRVIATHMCGYSEDCVRPILIAGVGSSTDADVLLGRIDRFQWKIFKIRPSHCYIVRYDRSPFITNGFVGPPRYGVSVFSSAGEMRMCDSPHSLDQIHRFRRSCSMKKNWQNSDDPVIGGRQPGLVFMQDASGAWHPGLCYERKPPITPGGPTLYTVRTIGKSDEGPFTLSRSHLLPYNIQTVLVLRQRGKMVHIDGLPEFEGI